MFPEELLLLLGYLRQRISLLNILEEGQFRGGGLSLNISCSVPSLSVSSHLALTLLLVESGEKVGELRDLFTVWEDNGMSSCLKLQGQVGRVRVGVDPCAPEGVEQVLITLGDAPQV